MKYSVVTCGLCGKDSVFVVAIWPPEFFWCFHCHSVFVFKEQSHTDAVTWRLRGYPQS